MSVSGRTAGKAWVPEINLTRGFAILSVIFIHVTAYFGRASILTPIVLINMVLDGFLHYAVPLFILISGLVLSINYWRGENKLQFYRKRFRYVIPQYVIFSAVYIAFSAIILGWPVSLPIVLGDLFAGTAWVHLWFIPLILEFYLLFPIFVLVYDYFEKHDRLDVLLVSALVIQFSFSIGQVLTDTVIFGSDAVSQLIFNSFVSYIFYFLIGIYIGRNIRTIKDRIKSYRLSPFVLLALICGFIPTLYYSTRYFGMPGGLSMNLAYLSWSLAIPLLTLAMFVLFFRLASRPDFSSSKTGYFVNEMGTYAFGIYLIHPLFITGYELVLTHIFGISVQTALFYALLSVLTIGSSYAFVKVVTRLPYGNWVIGVRNRKPSAQTSDISSSPKL